MKALMASKTVEKWPKKKIDAYLTVYESKEEVQKLWNRYLKFVEFYPQYFPEDIFKPNVGKIQCPVLFTHGDMVSNFSIYSKQRESKLKGLVLKIAQILE